MKSMYKLLLSALVLTLVIVYGCTDRGFNQAPILVNDSGVLEKDHVFYDELTVQIRNAYQQFFMSAYVPKVKEWTVPPEYEPPERMPVLVLLPPHGGDEYYYFSHGLAQVANELIEAGTIDPMLIVIPSNDKVFGGYWWSGGHWAPDDTSKCGSGRFDDLVGGSLINYLYDTMFTTWADTGAGFLGIGGIGTGAYGAYRAAMLHPGRFGSVSGIEGPMDFDGGAHGGGLPLLFPQVLAEQGLLGDPNYALDFDSLSGHRLSRLFIGGCEAFSPHDTVLYPKRHPVTGKITCPIVDTVIDTITFSPFVTDTSYTRRRWQILGDTTISDGWALDTISTNPLIVDSTVVPDGDTTFYSQTLVSGLIGEGSSNGYEQHFHLPFDANGDPYSTPTEPIWALWMRNNLDSLYLNQGGNTALQGTKLWLGYSTDPDPLGFNSQTQDWIDFLQGQGLDPEVVPYSGYDDVPALNDKYLNTLLRNVLIFHDREFKAAKIARYGSR